MPSPFPPAAAPSAHFFPLRLVTLVLVSAGLLIPGEARAQTVHDSALAVALGNWSAAGSWSHNPAYGGYPNNTASDVFDVTLGNAGTVTLDVSATINALNLTSAGTVAGTGALTTNGLLTWTAGTVSGGTAAALNANSGVLINGTTGALGRVLNNAGTTTMTSTVFTLNYG